MAGRERQSLGDGEHHGSNRMTLQRRELYRSAPNGDRWSLVRETTSERVVIEHEPNASSGGQTTHIEIADFLMHGGYGPEHHALLRLIGTLVEEPARS
jgi:hypothetical protein